MVMMASMATLSNESVHYIINHIVLPPKLPHEAENPAISRKAEQDLLHLVLGQVKAYAVKSSTDMEEHWRVIDRTLTQWITLNGTEKLSLEALVEIFASIKFTGNSELRHLYIHN